MRFKAGALLLLVLMISCLAPLAIDSPAQAVQGDVAWTRTLPTAYSSGTYYNAGVVTHGDGTVTATACGSVSNLDDTQSMVLSPENDVLTNVTGMHQGGICTGRGAAGFDGMLFYSEQPPSSPSVTKLVAAKNGVQLASHSITYQCSVPFGTTYYGIPSGMKIGADGNLYAIVIRQSCSTTPNLLVSLDGQTGQIRFQQPLTYGNTYQGNNTIGVYDSGVVVAEDNVSSSYPDLLSYFDYSGTKNNTLSCEIDGATDPCGFSLGGAKVGSVEKLIVKLDGTVYLDTYGGSCPGSRKTLKYTADGVASSITRPHSCQGQLMQMTPSGYLVYYYNNSAIVQNDSGVVQYQGNLSDKPGYTFIRTPYPGEILIDGNGDVVVLRYARLTSSSVRHLYIDKLNSNGTWTTLFSTEQLPNPSGNSFYFDYAYDVPNVAFAKDYLYLAVCRDACSSSNGPMLHKISIPGMELEYPRSEIFAEYTSDNGEQLDYVALGDSFSSGEGVPEFIAGTNVAGPPENRCHRSLSAYPMQLDSTASLDLNLRKFRACSGATVDNVRYGMYGEAGQLDSVAEETDVVTLTVGGNDIGFSDFAEWCISDGCPVDGVAYLNRVDAIESELDPQLELLYKDVLDKNGDVELYVVGYPYITRDDIEAPYDCYDYGSMTRESAAGAYGVVTLLNEAIESAVDLTSLDGYGSRIHYVDPNQSGSPFENHSLCHMEPFFNQLDAVNPAYSFHPNLLGQTAYGLLLQDYLTP